MLPATRCNAIQHTATEFFIDSIHRNVSLNPLSIYTSTTLPSTASARAVLMAISPSFLAIRRKSQVFRNSMFVNGLVSKSSVTPRVCLMFMLCIQCQAFIQGGENSQDPLSLQVIFRKSDLHLVALLCRMICNLGDPMSLHHPIVHFVPEYCLFYRSLSQKRPIILSILLNVATTQKILQRADF